jgi:hypothetical protein
VQQVDPGPVGWSALGWYIGERARPLHDTSMAWDAPRRKAAEQESGEGERVPSNLALRVSCRVADAVTPATLYGEGWRAGRRAGQMDGVGEGPCP